MGHLQAVQSYIHTPTVRHTNLRRYKNDRNTQRNSRIEHLIIIKKASLRSYTRACFLLSVCFFHLRHYFNRSRCDIIKRRVDQALLQAWFTLLFYLCEKFDYCIKIIIGGHGIIIYGFCDYIPYSTLGTLNLFRYFGNRHSAVIAKMLFNHFCTFK